MTMRSWELTLEGLVFNVLKVKGNTVMVSLLVSRCIDVDAVLEKRCPFCGRQFKRRWETALHIKRVHPIRYSELIECVSARMRG